MADHPGGTVGQQLGNYRLIQLLGQGGFANVYLGEHVYLNTFAAIKVLHTRLVDDDLAAFLNEARTVASLVHPHIVRVLDFGVEDDTAFLVMEYAPNGTLRKRHPKGTLFPLNLIVQYINQIAAGLQYAHDRSLIHRDVKPENMLLGANNQVLLSDFGLVLVAQSSRFQNTQDAVGTMAYMAPEQLQGKPRPASDQYALGVIAYEWLSGEYPFGGSFPEVASQHMLAAPPSLQEKVPTISPAIEQVVQIALAKDPRQRFVSVQMFASALEQACLPLLSQQSVILTTDSPAIGEPIAPRSSPSWLSSPLSLPDDQLLRTPVLTPLIDSTSPPPSEFGNAGQPPLAALNLRAQADSLTPSPDAPGQAFLGASSLNGPASWSPITWANQRTVPTPMPSPPVYNTPRQQKTAISRRTVILGLAGLGGLALVGGGLLAQTLRTPTTSIIPTPTLPPTVGPTQAPIFSHATPTPTHAPTPTPTHAPTATPILAPDAVVSSGPGILLQDTQLFSFDSGVVVSGGGDISWQLVKKNSRTLDAQGSAKLVNAGVNTAAFFDAIIPAELRAIAYSTVPIAGDQLLVGDIFAVLTNGGNHAKVQVLLHMGGKLEIRWVTYKG